MHCTVYVAFVQYSKGPVATKARLSVFLTTGHTRNPPVRCKVQSLCKDLFTFKSHPVQFIDRNECIFLPCTYCLANFSSFTFNLGACTVYVKSARQFLSITSVTSTCLAAAPFVRSCSGVPLAAASLDVAVNPTNYCLTTDESHTHTA